MSGAAREKLFETLFYATSDRACSESERESYRKEAQALIADFRNEIRQEVAEELRAEIRNATGVGRPEWEKAIRDADRLINTIAPVFTGAVGAFGELRFGRYATDPDGSEAT